MKKFIFFTGTTAGLALLLITSVSSNAQTGTISLTISALKSDRGKCLIYLYRSEGGFPVKPEAAFKKIVNEINGLQSSYEFKDIPFGVYAISVVHDENNNGKLDTNLIGLPKEGIGVTNNAKGSFGPPKFKDAKFDHYKPLTTCYISISY